MRPLPRYRHTQFGAVIVASLLLAAAFTAGVGD